jgi:hypothetical protein
MQKTPWDRLKDQFKPDGKGRFKTLDAMKIATQIDKERLAAEQKIRTLEQELKAYKAHLRAVTANK